MKIVLALILSISLHAADYKQVVIWGHKNPTHTHHYIHHAFYRAFQYLGYPTLWLEEGDETEGIDFSGSLFLTEGQVDGSIPLLIDAYYILHNCSSHKYQALDRSKRIEMQVYTDDVLSCLHCIQISPCIYYQLEGQILFMPWATDLLPEEIDEIKRDVKLCQERSEIYWIGTLGEGPFGNESELGPFIKASFDNDIHFFHLLPGQSPLKDHIKRIQDSLLAPAIVGEWQKRKGYIPCRIFKNISYGAMGVTNSYRVYELFQKKIVYNPDTYQLFYDAKSRLETYTLEEQYALMDFVRDNHTYLNRIETLLNFLKLVEEHTR